MAGIIGQSAGLLFKIDADSTGAQREFKAVDAAIGNLGGKFSSFAGVAAIGATAIASVGTAALAASVQLFNLVKATSDYGSEIYNVSVKTGLSAEVISSLKLASDRTGVSMESLGTIVGRFSRVVGEAAQGSETARENLKRLGVEPQEAIKDLEGGLGTVFKRISELPNPIAKATAAQQLFGKAGTELLKILDDFNGDLPKLIAEAKKLGVTLSTEDVKAADEFGDTLDTLKRQAGAVGDQFALELMPSITQAMRLISESFTNNKGVAEQWGKTLINVAYGTESVLSTSARLMQVSLGLLGTAFAKSKAQALSWSDVMQLAVLGPLGLIVATLGAKTKPIGIDVSSGPLAGRRLEGGDFDYLTDLDIGKKANDKAKRDAEKAAREAEQIADRNLRAKIQIAENLLREFQSKFEGAVSTALENLTGTDDETIVKLKGSFGEYLDKIQRTQAVLKKLQDQRRSTMTDEEKNLLSQQQRLEKEKIRLETAKTLLTIDKAAADFDEKAYKAADEALDREIKKIGELIEKNQELLKLKREEMDLAIGKLAPDNLFNPEGQNGPGGPFDGWTDSWLNFLGAVEGGAPTLKATLTEVNQILQNAFQGLAQAIGSVVEQWVIYGDAGPNAMRKVLAAALASIAAEAAVRAIYATAMGFFFLATGQYVDATNAFISAAIFGSIAVGAALAGRAVAGNSFRQQSSAATGGSGASGGQPAEQNNSFGGRFAGYIQNANQRQEQFFAKVTDRLNAVEGYVGDAFNQFTRTFGVASPSDVVMAGAGGASGAIFDATTSELSKGGRGSESLFRATGVYK